MITVDLERNDLGRVARGRRPRGFAPETFATVHHLVADVVADVAPGRDAFDLLAALFPGGSITGAPKLASMAAIAELEGEGRGFFTGSAGFVDIRRRRAAFDILIRTLVWRDEGGGRGTASYHVGGGITWSPDAAAEDAETLAKGAALARALDPEVRPRGRSGHRGGGAHARRASGSARGARASRAVSPSPGRKTRSGHRPSPWTSSALAARPRACGNGFRGRPVPSGARVRAPETG